MVVKHKECRDKLKNATVSRSMNLVSNETKGQ